MPSNVASQFSSDVVAYIADETLPLARRQLVVYQFGDPLTLPKGRGTTYTASRYNRIPLPYAPLSETVPPPGQTMTITQVTATASQWGDKVTISDVAEMTVYHPLFEKAMELVALQIAETMERNTFVALMAGTQINYVNTRGARASLVAGDVLNPHEINRVTGSLFTLGAPRFMGDEQTDTKLKADAGGAKASSDPRSMPHYTAVIHPLVAQDMRENASVVQAWSYSDINRLYNYELGEFGGVRFTFSNMVPTFTGVAQINPVAGTNGSLATGNYFVVVTASDTTNQYESRIYQVSASTAVTGPNGSLSVTLPALPGFTFSVYVGTTSSPTNLGLCPVSGPTVGPLQGQATQLAPNQTVVITGTGASQTPPAAPATGVTVYPTFVFGRGAYGQVVLDDVKYSYLSQADKSDVLNQLRIIGWKCFYGTLIQNQSFFARVESTSAFSSAFG
jgi:N4-gp56 family major capsid protein